jgi:hypothetical protein
VCGPLRVLSSLVSKNQEVGIAAYGVDAEITDTVVRDTEAGPQEVGGHGIHSQCFPESTFCGQLTVVSSLVTENRDVGIYSGASGGRIESTEVRGTLDTSAMLRGLGILAECDPTLYVCGPLEISSSSVSGNAEVGLRAIGIYLEISDSVVRDTLPATSGTLGIGIDVECDPQAGSCGFLQVLRSQVTTSQTVGIFIYSVPANLVGVVVRETRDSEFGILSGMFGQGIWDLCLPELGDCGLLNISSSLISTSDSAGIALEGVSGTMTASVVETVAPQSMDGKYGYGVQIGGRAGDPLPSFHIKSCQITDAVLAGVLFYRSQGMLRGSVVSGGEYSVVMNEGSSPMIEEDNDLSGSVSNDPRWAALRPSPAPPPGEWFSCCATPTSLSERQRDLAA